MTTDENSTVRKTDRKTDPSPHEQRQTFTAALLTCVTPADVASVVLERGMAALGAGAGLIALRTAKGQELEIVRSRGYPAEVTDKWRRFSVEGPLPLSEVVRAGVPLFLEDSGAWATRFPEMISELADRFDSAVFLPLSARQRVFGAIHFSFVESRGFGDEERAFLEELGQQCALALDRAQLLEAVEAAQVRAETMLESIGEEFYALDSEWRLTYVNRRASEIWGLSREELLGRIVWDVFPQSLGGVIYDAHVAALRERRAVRFEAISPLRGRWVEGAVYPAEGGGISVYLHDIHERKTVEQAQAEATAAVRWSEERYRRLLDTALEGVLFLDSAGVIASVNQQFVRMLGYETPHELVGQSFDSLFFPENQAHARSRWAARQQGVEEEYELRLRRKDGSACWAIAHVSIERDPNNGAFLGTFTMITDITERRRTAEALQSKSNEISATLESIGDAFFALDREWRFTYVNKEAERFLLRLREDLIGRTIWDEFPASVGSEFETAYRQAMSERATVSFVAYYPPPLDSWFDVRTYPSETGLSVYFRNINEERRQAEEKERLLREQERLVAELKKANAHQKKSLQASEERFRLLVEGVKDYAIFLLDPEGRVATWNAGAQRFKGYQAEEIIGSHFSRFYTDADISARHPWHELEIATEHGRYEEEGWRLRKDGSRFWAHVVITALRDDSGKLQGFAKVTRDVTERRDREKERVAAEMAEQQRRLLKDMLAYVTEGRLILCDAAAELPAPISSDSPHVSIPLSRFALKTIRAAVGEIAEDCHLPRERIQDLVTAASECAMNAVQHAETGTARVYGSRSAGIVQVWVEDQGTGIDLSNLPRAALERGYSTGGSGFGHGFNLMLACCQRIYLLTGTTGTTVVLEQESISPEPAWLK
jgi:PAS domain S-box-containing protein